jgi:hypothetical protein
MAIGLIVEVMDYAPATLTHREHKILIILAEDANLDTRVTWHSVDSLQILRRARVSRPQLYEAIKALIDKGCLERTVAGGGGHVAKYRIPALAPPGLCLENPDTDDPGLCLEKRDAAQGVPDAPEGTPASGIPGHSASGFSRRLLPITPASVAAAAANGGINSGSGRLPAGVVAPATDAGRPRPAPSQTRKKREFTTARTTAVPDDQHLMPAVPVQGQATGSNARASASGRAGGGPP